MKLVVYDTIKVAYNYDDCIGDNDIIQRSD